MGKTKRPAVVSVEQLWQSILVFRGHKVLRHEDLAVLYGVATRVLLQAVRRQERESAWLIGHASCFAFRIRALRGLWI